MKEVIDDLKMLKWDLHNNCWYDLEDEIRIMDNIDKAIKELKK